MVKQEKATLTMTDALKNRARVKAILQGKNLSRVVRELLELWLEDKIQLPTPASTEEDEPNT